jgi:hypothetical protein
MERSPELEDLMRSFYEALNDGDVRFPERFISEEDGVLFIGSDPDEWWEGFQTITTVMAAQVVEMAGVKIDGADPHGYVSGDVGWVADRPTFNFPDLPPTPFRITSVFHREPGGWRLVQAHTSLGVPNEEVIGSELTT